MIAYGASAMCGTEDQPTTLGECGGQAVTTAKRVAVFLIHKPGGKFKTPLADRDVTVVTDTGFGAANTSTVALSAVKRSLTLGLVAWLLR